MRKKYLSALLFGALLVASTGTFTSCKDYDDDINNLQEQISGQEGVSTKISAIESTISSLQSAQSGLQSAIDAAESAAQQAALTAQNAAIEAAKADLEAAKAELQAAATADKEELQAAIATVNETLAGISGSIQTLEQFKTNTEASLEALAQADTNLQNAITELEASVAENAQQIAANKTAIEAQVAALDEYKALTGADIDALKASIEAIEAGQLTEEMANKIAEQVTETVGAELDVISAAFSKAVTFVTVVNYNLNGSNNSIVQGALTTLDLRTAVARVDYTFGKDEVEAGTYEIANQREFKKGERAFLSDSIVIRVSPTNAVLTPQQISFVNSDKVTLDNLVTIESVEPVKGVATRGISANGLWQVKFKLNEASYKDEAYNAASKYDYKEGMDVEKIKELKDILYAVAVKDTPEDTERYVTSGYDLTLGNEYDYHYDLEFMVNDTYYKDIRNRYYYAEERNNDYTNDNQGHTWVVDEQQNLLFDKAWDLDAEGELQEDGTNFLTEVDGIDAGYTRTIYGNKQDWYYGGDERNSRNFFMAKPNEAFTVRLGNENQSEADLAGIYGFYVTLDSQRAVESAPSEINAWNSYAGKIEGLNQITTSREITLNIKDESANGDIIGFRVYAINQDGTLVDPDGKAFYVSVGNIAQIEVTDVKYTPTEFNDQVIDEIPIPAELTQLFKQSMFYRMSDWTVDYENNPVVSKGNNTYKSGFRIEFIDENGNSTSPYYAETMKITLNELPWMYKDGGTYSGTFNIRNEKEAVVRTVKVSFTKEMPTFPSEFSMKNNQLTNGAKEVVVNINNWNNNPVHNLGTAFNGISTADNAIVDRNYTFTSDNDQIVFNSDWINNDDRYGFYLDVDNNMNDAAKLFSDKNTTDKVYNVTVGYVYEGISSESDDTNYEVDAPTDKNFKMRLVCGNGLTSEWKNYDAKKAPIHSEIVYGQTTRIAAADILKLKEGDTNITTLTASQIKDCHLATGGVNDEYFKVSFDESTQEFIFTTILTENPPVSDIKGAELKFTLVDVFGHENPESYKYIDITLQ
ncbi:hypothetical protein [Bacteroides sp. An269]|uniref:hypothetical protein n=1 Tax=Bacteroides sp. An269 TaxID=1965613 RepID=UPI000B36C026|nr:hypothetical protein [Bacteroides sp. An269]OUO66050.1 hypothetical protein B5F71_18725 [Bacteroides sp. An269]